MKNQTAFWTTLLVFKILLLVCFLGCKKEALATLTTVAVSEISAASAKSGGNIIDNDGVEISSRGLAWATLDNPSLGQHLGIITEGRRAGLFISSITNLSPGTSKYVRAYVVNGEGTANGEQVRFSNTPPPGSDKNTQVVIVFNHATGKIWIDINLGAGCTASKLTDNEAFGNLYQGGRAGGHQKKTYGTASIRSTNNSPGNGAFLLSPSVT